MARAFRGEFVESEHYGHAVVVDGAGKIIFSIGEPETRVFLRSTAKPVQATPLIEHKIADHFGFTNREFALICASHNGEDFHVAAAQSMLDKIGVPANALQCGTHRPMGVDYDCVPETGERSPLQSDCSGKHVGMLAACRFHNWPIENYLSPAHPHQQEILEWVSRTSHFSKLKIGVAIDGCTAPVFNMPLKNAAQMYANLAKTSSQAHHSFQCMLQHPEMVAGTNRFDTAFMRTMDGSAVTKIGAEGMQCVALKTPEPIGLAVKIGDGGNRAAPAVACEILRKLDLITEDKLHSLNKFHAPERSNHNKIKIGRIEIANLF